MLVAARPAFANRAANLYNSLLYDAVVATGVDVVEFEARDALSRRPDVVHVHWPESALNKPRRRAAAYRSVELLVVLWRLRRRGSAVVWTAHNTASHGRRYPRAERLWWRAFVRLVDGWIALSETAALASVEAHPGLARLPHAVVAHGHYRGAYPAGMDKRKARAALGLGDSDKVLGFVGRVKPYKGVPELLRAFAAVPDASARLLVAGRCDEPELAAELGVLAAADNRVTIRLAAVADEDLQMWLGASDVVVAPYRAVLNSGSAMLALSFDRPVLAPATGSLVELAAALPDWVWTYDPPLTAEQLEGVLLRQAPVGRPDLHASDWDVAAIETVALYERAIAHARGGR